MFFPFFFDDHGNRERKQTHSVQKHNDGTWKGEEALLQTKLTGKTDELCFGCLNIHREEERMIQSIIFHLLSSTVIFNRNYITLVVVVSQTPRTVAEMIASLMT